MQHLKWLGLWSLVILLLLSCSSPQEKRDKFLSRGQQLEKQNELIKARLEYKNAIQVDPNCVECYKRLAKVELKLKNLKGAYSAYMQALEISPEDLDLQLAVGNLLLLGRAPEKAEQKARLILEKQPDKHDALALLALSLANQKDKEKQAIKELAKFRELEPRKGLGYVVAARLLMKENAFSKAEALLTQGLKNVENKAQILETLVPLYIKQGKIQKALEAAKKLAKLQKDRPESYLRLALLYASTGDLEAAQTQIDKALSLRPDDPKLIVSVSEFWLKNKRPGKAEKLLEESLGRHPEYLSIRTALARLYTLKGQAQKALSLLDEVKQEKLSDKDKLFLQNEKAAVLFALGKWDKAEELVDRVLKDNPKDLKALSIKARISLLERKATPAISALRTLVSEQPENVGYRLLLARAHFLADEKKLAEEQLKEAVKLSPKNVLVRKALIDFYLREQQLKKARKALEEAFKAVPDSPVLYLIKGQIAWFEKDLSTAEQAFRKAIDQAPEWLLPYKYLSSLLVSTGKVREAENDIKEAIAKHKKASNLQILLATIYELTGQKKKAVSIYEKLIKSFPDSPIICNNLAYFYAEIYNDKEHLTRALSLIKKAKEKAPDSPSILDTEAWILYKMGQYQKALEVINQAFVKEQTMPVFLYHKGLILKSLGKKEQAREVLSQALKTKEPFAERKACEQALREL